MTGSLPKKNQLKGEPRTGTPRAIRRQGLIPAVVYGHNLPTKVIAVAAKELSKVWRAAGATSLVTLALGDKDEQTVLIRDIQHHPVRGDIIHVDFYQVRLDEMIRAKVPLKFVGEADAVKNQGGVLVRNMDEIELEALPADLPHDIAVDISALTDFEKVIHVSDLTIPKGVKHFHQPEDMVALVQPPRTEAELEALKTEVKEEVAAVEGVVKPEAPTEGEAAKEEKGEEKSEEEKK